MLQPVFDAFGISMEKNKAVPFGSGLINHTWKINGGEKAFILQKINTNVFKNPEAIAYNTYIAGMYLRAHDSSYLFVTPERSIYNKDIFFDKHDGYFRLLPFIENSHTIDVVKDPQMAFEAARQFGLFTKLLSGLDACMLKITLPDFHNLSFRYEQFEEALAKAPAEKTSQSKELINLVFAYKDIVDEFERIKTDPQFKIRVTHHDTKISNVLFDEDNKGLCVIDLDTMMPGYFISDLGDMLRTYLSPVSEEEKDFLKIEIRDEYFISIISGYLGELQDVLTEGEKGRFVYAGKFMIYMQALRFLTDHLNNDIYYDAKYPGHNFVRAGNQFVLLEKLTQKEDQLQHYVDSLTINQN
jgi:thiamine kinase-like enzyme